MKKQSSIMVLSLVFGVMMATSVFADKTSVQIEAPAKAKKGETITITVKVTHDGNNIFHFTNWVYVKVNGKEVARWEYSVANRPESENLSLTTTVTVEETAYIEAMGNCNLHGSTGMKTHTVTVE